MKPQEKQTLPERDAPIARRYDSASSGQRRSVDTTGRVGIVDEHQSGTLSASELFSHASGNSSLA
jgi:hypothetical protein